MQLAAVQQQRFACGAPSSVAGQRRQQQQQWRRAGGAVAVAAQLAEGQRVRVTRPVTVWHVGKFKGGLDLQGMEGTVLLPNVNDYQGQDGRQHTLSANLTVKCQFAAAAPDGGKDVKIIAHLVRAIARPARVLAALWGPGAGGGGDEWGVILWESCQTSCRWSREA